VTELTDPWADRAYLRDVQYRTDANLAARQSIYSYQQPHIDLKGRVIDLAAPVPGETVCDVGCGNGTYLAELARRGFTGPVLGVDMSLGMLAAARERLGSVGAAGAPLSAVTAASAGALPAADAARSATLAGPMESGVAADSAEADSPATVGLLAADATALPLRDGAADLTLAMHMLYHVADPSEAVRELRRVTRPGGRVVIGLNGAGHLRQLRAVVAAVRGDDLGEQRERVTLDDGESLARHYFSRVTRRDFVSELRIPDQEPIADYVRSMSGTQHGADSERLVAAVVSRFPAAPGAVVTVTTHAGCLICTV
jgi:ubiquinone/menaquinone biosynthesis C-methylase UbiE